MSNVSKIHAWSVFLLSVLFSAYSVTLQFSPSFEHVIGQEVGEIKETIYALSGFYYTFALFQIPAGILIDRYGSRILPSIGIVLCALGAILMSQSHENVMLAISRGIMGLGAAFSFLNGLKLINNWFHPKKFAYLIGLFMALASAGIVIFRASFDFLATAIKWQGAMMTFGICGLLFAVLFFCVVRNAPHPQERDQKTFWKNIRHVFNSSHVWINGIVIGLVMGPLFAFEATWAIPFVKTAYNLPYSTAAMYSLLLVLGYAIGIVFFGRVSTSIGRRKTFIPWGIGISLMMLVIILYPPYLGIRLTASCFFVLGFAATNVNLGYTIVHEHHVPQVTATSMAVVNTFYAFFVAISQPLIANFLHSAHFTLKDFQVSLTRLPIYLVIALIFSFFIKESFSNQRYHYDD